jgi:hypothetical protein
MSLTANRLISSNRALSSDSAPRLTEWAALVGALVNAAMSQGFYNSLNIS